MTPLEWTEDAITRHAINRLDKKIDANDTKRSDYSRALDKGQELSEEYFLRELHQLKELLVTRPPLTAKEAND